jgi:hypothetical protein
MQWDEKCGQRNEHRRIESGKKYNLRPLRPLRIFERHNFFFEKNWRKNNFGPLDTNVIGAVEHG